MESEFFSVQTKTSQPNVHVCVCVSICLCVKIYLCTHKHVWESEQEMARMCRIPNFPHGLFLGRKLQLSFRLSVPLTEDRRDLWVGERRPLHPYTHGILQDDPVVYQKIKKGFSIILTTGCHATAKQSYAYRATLKCGSMRGPFGHTHIHEKGCVSLL